MLAHHLLGVEVVTGSGKAARVETIVALKAVRSRGRGSWPWRGYAGPSRVSSASTSPRPQASAQAFSMSPRRASRPPVADGATLADLAAGVIDEIPAGSHLLGFSLGALVAQQVALCRPELAATPTSVSSVCDRTAMERASVLDRLRGAEAERTSLELFVTEVMPAFQ